MKTQPNYPARQRSTPGLVATLLLSIVVLAVMMLVTSCAPPSIEGANPLDRPQDLMSAEAIRADHMKKITSNPGWQP